MNMDPLFKAFDELADSPERIPALRKVLLTYLLHSAVNTPDAIPRAETVREAHEIRRRGLTQNANRKYVSSVVKVTDKDLPPSLSDIPTALFDRLGNIAWIEKGLSQIQSTRPGKYPLVVTAETRSSSESFDFEGAAAIIPLVSSTGHGDASLKRLHYQEGRYAVGNILAVVKPICPSLLRARFIYEYLSAFKEELLVSRMVGTANVSLTVKKLKEVPIPLVSGPLLSRIDELMALCDRLEAQQRERETRHATLARASLARFADAPTPASLQYLFHPSYTISPADLRKSILTLAVQGKLVPQDPNDEPAEKLFARLELERRHFAGAHNFRAPVDEPLDDLSVPFILPKNWKWCRLSSVFNAITDGDHLPPPKSGTGIAFLTIGNITTGSLDFGGSRFVPDSYYQGLASFRRPIRGDILYTVVGATYGRPALVETDRPFCVQRHIAILKPPQSVDSGYLMAALRSPLVYDQASASTTGTAQPTIPLGSLRNFSVPLPPLAEQRRIVKKVEQLMTLVDALETHLATSRTTAANLLSALVAKLTGSTPSFPPSRLRASQMESLPQSLASPRINNKPSREAEQDNSHEGAKGKPPNVPSLEEEAALLALLHKRGVLTNADAQAATGLDAATIRAHLQALVSTGRARTEGQRRGMRYLAVD